MFDPRDDTRDRGEDGRERAHEGRDRTGDSRDVFLHDVDLPLDREREYVLDRDQVYELDGDDSRTLATVGAFRIVPPGAGPRGAASTTPTEGIAFDGHGSVGTAVTAPAFNHLRPIETGNEGLVDLTRASWNRWHFWLRQLASLREAA